MVGGVGEDTTMKAQLLAIEVIFSAAHQWKERDTECVCLNRSAHSLLHMSLFIRTNNSKASKQTSSLTRDRLWISVNRHFKARYFDTFPLRSILIYSLWQQNKERIVMFLFYVGDRRGSYFPLLLSLVLPSNGVLLMIKITECRFQSLFNHSNITRLREGFCKPWSESSWSSVL